MLFWLRLKLCDIMAGLLLLIGALLVFLTPLILFVPAWLFWLRQLEKTDPVIAPRPSNEHVRALAELEDYDLVNPFTGFGSGKPGLFRLGTLIFLLFLLNFAARVIYARGRLARIEQFISPAGCFWMEGDGCFSRATMTEVSRRTRMTSSTRSRSASILSSATGSAFRACDG